MERSEMELEFMQAKPDEKLALACPICENAPASAFPVVRLRSACGGQGASTYLVVLAAGRLIRGRTN